MSRTFTGGTSQNFEEIIDRLPTPFRNNRQLQTPQIISNFMLHISQSIRLPSPKHTEITHHETPGKKNALTVWHQTIYLKNALWGVRTYIEKLTKKYGKFHDLQNTYFTVWAIKKDRQKWQMRSQNYIENIHCQTPEKQQFTFVRRPTIFQRKWPLNTPQLMDNFDLWCPTKYRDSGTWDA